MILNSDQRREWFKELADKVNEDPNLLGAFMATCDAGDESLARAVPLHEQLRKVPRDARIEETDSFGTTFHPVGLMCHRASRILKDMEMTERAKEMIASVPKPMSMDPWQKRATEMKCRTCMWFVAKVPEPGTESSGVGRCRRHAPTMGGYPVVKTMDWCGDHRLDETK